MSATPAPDAETPDPARRVPLLDVALRLIIAALALCSAVAVFGIIYTYARHHHVPLFIAVMMGLLTGACPPCLVGLGQMLGESTYLRGLVFGFAVAGVVAWVVGSAEGSGWYVTAPLPLIATGATAVAIKPFKP